MMYSVLNYHSVTYDDVLLFNKLMPLFFISFSFFLTPPLQTSQVECKFWFWCFNYNCCLEMHMFSFLVSLIPGAVCIFIQNESIIRSKPCRDVWVASDNNQSRNWILFFFQNRLRRWFIQCLRLNTGFGASICISIEFMSSHFW